MDRAKKEALVADLHETLSSASLVVLTHTQGLTVAEVSDLRAQMRDAGASFKVTKNTLAKIALKDTQFEYLSDRFSGPTAVATSSDPVAAAKVAVSYAKEKKEKLNRIFHVWFNTHFVEDNRLVLSLEANDIDGIKKTKKLYPKKFAVEFLFGEE